MAALALQNDVMIGAYVRPWPEERLVGQIVAVSGDMLICKSVGGDTFCIRMADVPKMTVYRHRHTWPLASVDKPS